MKNTSKKFKNIAAAGLLGLCSIALHNCGDDSTLNRQASGEENAAELAREGSPAIHISSWQAEFYQNMNLSGRALLQTINQPDLNINWGTGSPGGIPQDQFSARLSTTAYTSGGNYLLSYGSDDGIRIYIDNQLVVNNWVDQGLTAKSKTVYMTPGNHSIRVEYYENSGAAALQLSIRGYQSIPLPPVESRNWKGEYYQTTNLTGRASIQHTDEIDFNWGSGGPSALGGQNDYFSARWTKTAHFNAGTQRITTQSDDGVRVYVDGRLVIDNWTEHALTTDYADVYFSQGLHTIEVQYFELTGGARIKLSIGSGCQTKRSNILACAVPYELLQDSYVTVCKLGTGECETKTSYASDNGFVKFDGFQMNSCQPAPQYSVKQVTAGQQSNYEVVTLVPDQTVRVNFCRNFSM